jgi:tight adherence protein B
VTLLAALATGVAVYVAVGLVTGWRPAPRAGARVRRREAAQRWLLQAGVALTPAQYWAASVAIGCGVFVLLALATATPSAAVVPGVVAGALPRAVFARRRVRRLRAVQEAWPDALRELVASILAGRSLAQALSGLARSGPEPIREAFARFDLLARVLGVVPALEVIKAELADPTSDRVLEVLVLAHERGGRIVAEVLRDLADATNDEHRIAEQIATVLRRAYFPHVVALAHSWLSHRLRRASRTLSSPTCSRADCLTA